MLAFVCYTTAIQHVIQFFYRCRKRVTYFPIPALYSLRMYSSFHFRDSPMSILDHPLRSMPSHSGFCPSNILPNLPVSVFYNHNSFHVTSRIKAEPMSSWRGLGEIPQEMSKWFVRAIISDDSYEIPKAIIAWKLLSPNPPLSLSQFRLQNYKGDKTFIYFILHVLTWRVWFAFYA